MVLANAEVSGYVADAEREETYHHGDTKLAAERSDLTLADAEREQILGALCETGWVMGGPKGQRPAWRKAFDVVLEDEEARHFSTRVGAQLVRLPVGARVCLLVREGLRFLSLLRTLPPRPIGKSFSGFILRSALRISTAPVRRLLYAQAGKARSKRSEGHGR